MAFQDQLMARLHRYGDRTAIETTKRKITYSQLVRTSNRISTFLLNKSLEKEAVVGVLLDERADIIPTVIGIMNARCVFVTLDSTLPKSRLDAMINDLNLRYVISSNGTFKDEGIETFSFEDITDVNFDEAAAVVHPTYDTEDDIYVYFTSGSTGTPKGIVGRNGSLLQFIEWQLNEFVVDGNDRFSQFISPYFDAFLRDTFTPLFAGGTICIPPADDDFFTSEKLIPWIDQLEITMIHCVPTVFRLINTASLSTTNFPKLRNIFLSGEKIIPGELNRWFQVFNGRIQLVNFYGTTETTMIRSFHRISEEDLKQPRIPIGKPISDTELLILNNDLTLCNTLAVGDLYIVSDYLTKGYLNAPDLTNDKFVMILNKRGFKTGDKGRRLASGRIELMGRADRQVKVNGIRLELDEIESALMQTGMVKAAVVVPHEDTNQNQLLAAFVIKAESRQGDAEFTDRTVELISGSLPKYMVPGIVVLDEYPLLSNGKIDHKELLKRLEAPREIILPENEIEMKLLSVWKEILGNKDISTNEGFNKVGGNSLSIMNLIGKINRIFDVKLSLSQLFSNLTIKKQAELIRTATRNALEAIPRAFLKDHYVLTSAQKGLYFLYEFERTSLAYNLPQMVWLEGPVDMEKLTEAFRRLIVRHETLRTCFTVVDEEPVQRILDDVDFSIQVVPANGQDLHEKIEEFIKPFDLSVPPLMRAQLTEVSPDKHVLMVDIHHIIADGASQSILIRDFTALYDNNELAPLPITFKDFAEWQQSDTQRANVSLQREFWINEFQEVGTLSLPTDFQRALVRDDAGASLNFRIDADVVSKLKSIADQIDATMFVMILGVFNVLLHKLTNQEDIVVGTPVAGRQHNEFENVIGMFINTLPIRNYPLGDLTFRQFLENVRSKVLACLNNQDYPYEELIDSLNLERDTSRNPLFDAMLAYQNMEENELRMSGLSVKPFHYLPNGSKFDLTLYAFERGGALDLKLEYSAALFSREMIGRFISYFESCISSVIADVEIKISQIDILSADEKKMLIHSFNGPTVDVDEKATIVSLFEKQAENDPDKVAIIFEGTKLTYRQLNERVNQLARQLHVRHSIKANDIVGMMIDRSELMLVGLFAILKAGGAYVPIDPTYPRDRINHILQDSRAKVLLTDSILKESLQFAGTVIDVRLEESYASQTSNPPLVNGSQDLCYVIYTSGSTGLPKGVMISHGSVVNFFTAMDKGLPISDNECLLAVTSPSFDISVLELFWTLCRGIEVVIHPSDLSLSGLDRYVSGSNTTMDFSLFFFSSYNNAASDKYNLLLESVKYADKSGFNAVWVPERHFHEFGGLFPNPSVVSSALAMITNQIALRSGSVVSPLHDAIRIAEDWSVIDNLSNGRVGLSFASGWNPNDFVLSQTDYSKRHQLMYEQIDEVKRLWRGETVKRQNGLGQQVEVKTFPAPIQKELPVWITAAGNDETFKSAGAIGANVLTHFLGQDIEELARKIQLYRESREAHGYDKASGRVSLMLHTYIGDDIDEVEKLVEQPFIEYLKSSIGLSKVVLEEAGLSENDIGTDVKQRVLRNSFLRYYKSASLIGTRSSCAETIEKLNKIGVDEVACLVDFGIGENEVLKGLSNLASLKDLFSGKHEKVNRPVTMMQSTPSFAKLCLETGSKDFLQSLRLLLLGGEALPSPLVNDLKAHSKAAIYNMYGPTETTIWSTMYHVPDECPDNVPIGAPIANADVYVLGKDQQLLPLGVTGDLYIGGKGIARGYWSNDKLTNERFIANPFKPGELIYRTGDLARWRTDGTLDFLGRNDRQVKIRGHRIELGEIEHCINQLDGVKESVVITKEADDGDKTIVAYIVSSTEINVTEIRHFLSQSLVDYMIPVSYVRLDKIPLTPNGKINRKALPESQVTLSENYVAPTNETEKKLLSIWSEVLKVNKEFISITSDFFELGGHSLRAITLMNKISKAFNVDVPLRILFQHKSIRTIARYIQASATAQYSPIVKAEEKEHYVLSDSQRAMYFLYEFDRLSLFYNLPRVVRLNGVVDAGRLQSAVNRLIARHEILRTSFELIDGEPVQKVLPHASLAIEYFKADSEVDVRPIAEKVIRPFDLREAPVLRCALIEISDQNHYLLIDTHHIIVDGTSHGILLKEFAALYNDEPIAELTIQYKDYAEWQQSDRRKKGMEKQKEFWTAQFADEMPSLELPADFSNKVPGGHQGGSTSISLNADATAKLKAIAEAENASLFMLILSAYNILLSRLANQEDILVGTLVSGREHADVESMMGMFVSTLPLRNYPKGELEFIEFLRALKLNSLACFENQAYLYKSRTSEFNIEKKSPLDAPYNAFFIFQNFEKSTVEAVPGMTFPEYYSEEIGESRYPINLVATEQGNEIVLTLACNRYFRHETRERFATYFRQILDCVLVNPRIKLSNIQMVTDAEKTILLHAFNSTRARLPEAASFSQLFKRQMERTPANIAVEYYNTALTYKELYEQAATLCRQLQLAGVGKNEKIAIYMERRTEILVSILAVFQAGCAYVPIDVDYPAHRTGEILTDSDVAIVITTSDDIAALSQVTQSIPAIKTLICADKIAGDNSEYLPEDVPYDADAIAYVIYTSGTTGKPKGVMIHQLGMINHLYAKINTLDLKIADVVAQTASPCFDISVWQFLAALLVGSKVHIIDTAKVLDTGRLVSGLQQGNITIFESVPSLITAFLDSLQARRNNSLPKLRWMIPTGEPLSVSLAKKWYQHFPDVPLLNAYGPTEASDDITHYVVPVPAESQSHISIGRPVQNTHIYILDKHLNPCPVGVKGEICVAGYGVGKGYWKNEDKTRNSFIPNPFFDQIDDDRYATIFKTGDVGYYLENGDIVCLGRIDEQVKVRGFRIEPAEIESILTTAGIAKQAVVLTFDTDLGKKLAVFLVFADISMTPLAVKNFLKERLPDYMVPSQIVKVDKIPKTNNGKVDKKALQMKISLLDNARENYVEPATEVESALAKIWEELMGIEKIGTNDDFFELGGHSLLAMRVVASIKNRLDIEIPIRVLFELSTINRMAKWIESNLVESPTRTS